MLDHAMLIDFGTRVAAALAGFHESFEKCRLARAAVPIDVAAVRECDMEGGYFVRVLTDLIRDWRPFFTFSDLADLPANALPGIADPAAWVAENEAVVVLVMAGQEEWERTQPAETKQLVAEVFTALHPT